MKHTFFALLFILTTIILSAEEKIIFSWDFSQKDLLTTSSAQLKLRGKATIKDGMLIVSSDSKSATDAAIACNKSALKLPPQGTFALTVTFMVGPKWERPDNEYSYLFDTKYEENKAKYHEGLMLYMYTEDGKTFTPYAVFGFGDKSAKVTGKSVTLKPNELHTLELTFTGRGKVFFTMDDLPCGDGMVPAGNIVSSQFAPVIGNRVGGNYGPFGGGIRKVVLKVLKK